MAVADHMGGRSADSDRGSQAEEEAARGECGRGAAGGAEEVGAEEEACCAQATAVTPRTLRVGLSHERHNLRIGTPDDDPALYARK